MQRHQKERFTLQLEPYARMLYRSRDLGVHSAAAAAHAASLVARLTTLADKMLWNKNYATLLNPNWYLDGTSLVCRYNVCRHLSVLSTR